MSNWTGFGKFEPKWTDYEINAVLFGRALERKRKASIFFPDPGILINNEPSLNWKCFSLYVTRELIWRQTPNLCITVHWNKKYAFYFKVQQRLKEFNMRWQQQPQKLHKQDILEKHLHITWAIFVSYGMHTMNYFASCGFKESRTQRISQHEVSQFDLLMQPIPYSFGPNNNWQLFLENEWLWVNSPWGRRPWEREE